MTTTTTDPAATLAAMGTLTADLGALLDTVEPADWTAATPCPGLDVNDLVDHLIAGLRAFTRVGNGEGRPDFTSEPVEPTEAAALYRAAAAAAAAVWAVPGRMEAEYAMPWGPSTGTQLLGFLLVEQVAHGWDIARATGRPAAFHPDAVALADAVARAMVTSGMRAPGMFGPEVTAPAGATPLDRLAAFLGRRP